MSIFDDLDQIFADTFGEDAIYTPQGNAARVVSAIIEEAGETLVSSGEVDVIARTPYADFRESVVTGAAEGDLLAARGKTWALVGGPVPDGRGMVRWLLELQE